MEKPQNTDKRKLGRPSRGLIAKSISLYDHQHNALMRIAAMQGRTFPEVLRSAMDGLNESMATVEFPASMQSVCKVTRSHITTTQNDNLRDLAHKTGVSMSHLTRVAVMQWLDNQPK